MNICIQHECVCVCLNICIYVNMYICIYICMCVCEHEHMYVFCTNTYVICNKTSGINMRLFEIIIYFIVYTYDFQRYIPVLKNIFIFNLTFCDSGYRLFIF